MQVRFRFVSLSLAIFAAMVPQGPARSQISGELLRRSGGLRMQFVEIAAGSFTMGSDDRLKGEQSDERPHEVELTRDFLMQATEVTQGQWKALMGNNPSRFTGDDDRPVEGVNWYDALAFANALSVADGLPGAYDLSSCSGEPGSGEYGCQRVGLTSEDPYAAEGWRLPTEAEWEYATRAGSDRSWYFGSGAEELGNFAWFGGNSDSTTHPVGGKVPNGWGLYDTAGNVWEWCWDWYDPNYTYATVENPAGPGRGDRRVARGGSWHSARLFTRSGIRDANRPAFRDSMVGFRLARSAF